MGIFLTESNLSISETNDRTIEPGFCFHLAINLPEIKYESKKTAKTFAIQISDIIIIGDKGQDVLTNDISKALQ